MGHQASCRHLLLDLGAARRISVASSSTGQSSADLHGPVLGQGELYHPPSGGEAKADGYATTHSRADRSTRTTDRRACATDSRACATDSRTRATDSCTCAADGRACVSDGRANAGADIGVAVQGELLGST
jgi:hypothetical protein